VFSENGISSLLYKQQPVHFHYETRIAECFIKEIEKGAIGKRMDLLHTVFNFLEKCKKTDPLFAFRMHIKYLFVIEMNYIEFGEIKSLELVYGNKIVIANNHPMLKSAMYSSDELFWNEWFLLFSKEMKKNRLKFVLQPKYNIYTYMLDAYIFRQEVKKTSFYHDFLHYLFKKGKSSYEIEILSKEIMDQVSSREEHLIYLEKDPQQSSYCLFNFGSIIAFVEMVRHDYKLIEVFENQTVEEVKKWFENVF
jgi:hypothetical protein